MNTAIVKQVVTVSTSGSNEWNQTIATRVKGITKKAYSWSKYGGANYGLVQEAKTPEWHCQACKETQTSDLPSYMFEFINGEFMRICADCQFLKLQHQVKEMFELVKMVRKLDDPD